MTATIAPPPPSQADSIAEIRATLQQRGVFLLVDRILDSDDTHIRCVKNVTQTDPVLAGHFPDEPLYPGVMTIEACAQAGGLLLGRMARRRGRAYLAHVGDFKFIKPIVPGDTMILHAEYVGQAGPFTRVAVRAEVDDDIVAKGVVSYCFR